MSIRIVTDSTCDLPADMVEQYNITVVPAYINIGTNSMMDGVELTHDDFYKNLSSYDSHPTTAAPSPGTFTEIYEGVAAEGATEIISMHVSSELSAFLDSARLGAEGTDKVEVTLIDSRQVSMGLGLLVLVAARALADGATVAETVKLVKERIPRTRVYAAVDTLEYLAKSGRVSNMQASVGSLLRIKPILEVKDGLATPFERVRTRKKMPVKLMELLKKQGPLEDLIALHINAQASAESLQKQMEPYYPKGATRTIFSVGPVIGAHAGPGTFGFACILKD